MKMSNSLPPQVEVYGYFRQHMGPRFIAAGLKISFEYDRTPGIHFRAPVSEEYRGAILKGIKDGLSARFPMFSETGSVWIKEVTEHPVDSSKWAFYLAARCVIEQAYVLAQLKTEELTRSE
jgi:hypothetical protein